MGFMIEEHVSGNDASSYRPSLADLSGEASSLAGQVLIAMPGLPDPEFSHSVVYLCAHTADGAMGIVVNRPLAAPSFADLLVQLDVAPTPPAREINLCKGGPVDNSRGFVLHTTDWTGDGSLKVDADVALTASLDILKALARGDGPREGILALGYANWGPGQLDEEIKKNSWLNTHPDMDLLFGTDHERKWSRAMAKLRIDPAMLSNTAGRA
jgi:putative transcriptional regulator